jgi:hypothetical protein
MNSKSFVKLTNVIGIITIILLVYLVFVFISAEMFGFKVFSENLAGNFYMYIVGLLSLMVGTLIINVMFNLTRIAEKHNLDTFKEQKSLSKYLKWVFFASFPIILGLLYFSNYLSVKNRETQIVQSVQSLIQYNSEKTDQLSNYTFDKRWINETKRNLELLSKTDKNFANITLIVKDSIDNSSLFLGFKATTNVDNNPNKLFKENYIVETSKDEREYLERVFNKNINEHFYKNIDGNYELFYPLIMDNRKVVLYFSNYQNISKVGS